MGIINTFVRHQWLVLLSTLVIGSLMLPLLHTGHYKVEPTPPARVIVSQVARVGQGAEIVWLEAQAGTYPLSGYVIERSRGHEAFRRIAHVEKVTLHYLDTDGRPGDAYRIIAEDSHQPVGHSSPSESVIAGPAEPGSKVVISPTPSRTLGIATTEATTTPDVKVMALQTVLTQAFRTFDTALNTNDIAAAKTTLNTLQDYQRQVLFLFPQLSLGQKSALAGICSEQIGVFKANLYRLAEKDQLDGLMVLAGCNAIQQSAI